MSKTQGRRGCPILLVFFLLFVAFSMKLTGEIAVFGAVVAVLVYGFCVRFMGYDPRTDYRILRRFGWGLQYVLLLVAETVYANVQVSRFVFSRRAEVAPKLLFFRTGLSSQASRVALASSITLTPGTITVAVNDDVFCVHCLNPRFAKGIENSRFARLLGHFEKKKEARDGRSH